MFLSSTICFIIRLVVCNYCHTHCVMVAVSSFDAYITIFQARIKKIMQADEDVGKIALAVPVLVCKSSCYH